MRIFVRPEMLDEGVLAITGDEHHYLSRVRRARPGDAVELVDGAGRRAAATISKIGDAATELAVAAPEDVPPAVPLVRRSRSESSRAVTPPRARRSWSAWWCAASARRSGRGVEK